MGRDNRHEWFCNVYCQSGYKLGLATPLTAQLVRNSAIKSELDVVFTVLTSPDTSKAAYWGHMPDTFTSSDGTEFRRPLLRAELSSTTNTSANAVNNETWYTWTKYPNLYQSSNSPCDRMGMPTLEQFKTLYNDYVGSGGLTQALGLPVVSNSSWGAVIPSQRMMPEAITSNI